MKKTDRPKYSKPRQLSVGPSYEEHAHLEILAKQLRKSPALVIAEFMRDCLEMLETGKEGTPKTVQVIRLLREHKATYTEAA